jgi:hypothetical protein
MHLKIWKRSLGHENNFNSVSAKRWGFLPTNPTLPRKPKQKNCIKFVYNHNHRMKKKKKREKNKRERKKKRERTADCLESAAAA